MDIQDDLFGDLTDEDPEVNSSQVHDKELGIDEVISNIDSSQVDSEFADQQSLLSEDPNDAEAEPDWLS